jgi:NAD(P)-dependent dehydrogenase (short-subunit alcohol dehydrogenase family)
VPDVHFYRCDVADTPAVEELCKEIRQRHGEATVLINNAGIGIGKTVLDVSATALMHSKLTNNFCRQVTQSARSSSRSISSPTLS